MKVAIIGRSEYLFNTARYLRKNKHQIKAVVTAEAAPEYTKKEEDFQDLASGLKVPFFNVRTLDTPEIAAVFNGLDVGVSVNWINIVKEKHIRLFRLGILNAHLGDLPRYRGNACPNWAIIQGENEVVLSIHLMEGNKLDSGRIIVQDKCRLENTTYIGDVYRWAEEAIPRAFLEALFHLEKDPAFTMKYANSSEGFRCYPRRPGDSQIDWQHPAEIIHRLIRASSEPLPGAYTFYNGRKMIIWRASPVYDQERYLAIPGQIAEVQNGPVTVITSNGKLKLEDVEYDGNRYPPSHFIHSLRDRLGI